MKYMNKRCWFKSLVTSFIIIALLFSTFASFNITLAAVKTDNTITRSERLEQPVSKCEFEKDELGVVNFHPTWGDKEKNIENMMTYIDEAHKKGVKILLFPEMCVTGYVSSSTPDSEDYKWAVKSAEELTGPTAKRFAKVF